jgi:hypothetical protein
VTQASDLKRVNFNRQKVFQGSHSSFFSFNRKLSVIHEQSGYLEPFRLKKMHTGCGVYASTEQDDSFRSA